MNIKQLTILLADDDADDRFFFDKILREIPIATHLTTVHDGEQLMNYLAEHSEHLPHVVFLDLNMPRKTGYECLAEIQQNKKLDDLPVVMYSTSDSRDHHYEGNMTKTLYEIGAHYYIRKTNDFIQLKQAIHDALIIVIEKGRLMDIRKNV